MAGVLNNQIGIEAQQDWGTLSGNINHLRNINRLYYSYSKDDLPYGFQSNDALWNNDKHNLTFNLDYSVTKKAFYANHTLKCWP